MVAKMPRSISFFITSAAFTSSFSESSLTVMPSEIVISRLIGGGPASTCRRCGRRIFSSSLRSRGCGRPPPGRWSPGRPRAGCSDRRRRSHSGLHATARGGMLRTRSTGTRHGRSRTRAGTPAWLPSAGRDGWVHDKSVGREPARWALSELRGAAARALPAWKDEAVRASPPDRDAAAPPAGPRAAPRASARCCMGGGAIGMPACGRGDSGRRGASGGRGICGAPGDGAPTVGRGLSRFAGMGWRGPERI